MKYFIVSIAIILSISCTKENGGSKIDEGLRPYYDSFLFEAESRNITLPDSVLNINLIFTDINNSNVLGQCNHNPDSPDVVQIDRFYWRTFDEPTREFVVFHELGHCILDRGHKDSVDSNGNCISLMHSSVGICKFEFTGENRKKYIDELFIF